jgi:DNA repair photolyase
MYPFIDFTWNTVKGECPHHCAYCYMKRWGRQNPARFDEREQNASLGENRFIFVGSSCDLFAMDIPPEWITKTLEKANRYNNRYLVQSKNPARFHNFLKYMDPARYVLATTLETNFHLPDVMGDSPPPEKRAEEMASLPKDYKRVITVEPVMKFDLKALSHLVLICNPRQVNIGADSGGHGLPEPAAKEVRALIELLSRYTTVYQKDNLKRLLREAV